MHVHASGDGLETLHRCGNPETMTQALQKKLLRRHMRKPPEKPELPPMTIRGDRRERACTQT